MTLADEVKHNTHEIIGLRHDVRGIASEVTNIQTDVKNLIALNGKRAGQVGELKGRLAMTCALVLAAIAGITSTVALIWVSRLG